MRVYEKAHIRTPVRCKSHVLHSDHTYCICLHAQQQHFPPSHETHVPERSTVRDESSRRTITNAESSSSSVVGGWWVLVDGERMRKHLIITSEQTLPLHLSSVAMSN